MCLLGRSNQQDRNESDHCRRQCNKRPKAAGKCREVQEAIQQKQMLHRLSSDRPTCYNHRSSRL